MGLPCIQEATGHGSRAHGMRPQSCSSPGTFTTVNSIENRAVLCYVSATPEEFQAPHDVYDVAVVGAGMAGLATALRLAAQGLSTLLVEAHATAGGCAGYFQRNGFSFDVGATTLVDFGPEGVGGELLNATGIPSLDGEQLSGYRAWLPDRAVDLHREAKLWNHERLRTLGDSPRHRHFWSLMDRLASVFWPASRRGIKLPIRSVKDALQTIRAVGARNLFMARFLGWTLGDALRAHGLREERPLVGLLSMLVEDTVHATVDRAPLINAALGITIRGAGLLRHTGGMRCFFLKLLERYRELRGKLCLGCRVNRIDTSRGGFKIEMRRGTVLARQVVCALPAELAARLGPQLVARALAPYLERDRQARGGAVVVFLGAGEDEVCSGDFTHHQILESYERPLGDGNNMFVSVSSRGDLESAPPGFRAVMLSTHCELEPWQNLTPTEYRGKKAAIGTKLLRLARRAFPGLGERPVVLEVGTPLTYQRFTGRPRGAVGGTRLDLSNSNQQAIPHQIGVPGFWLVGDTTWPGLGTVACVVGSRIVANGVRERFREIHRERRVFPSVALAEAP